MMRNNFILGILLALSIMPITAQTIAEADSLFAQKKYFEAKFIYEQVLAQKPVQLDYKYGACLFALDQFEEAKKALQRALPSAETDLYLGDIYAREYDLDKAALTYVSVQSKAKTDSMRNIGWERGGRIQKIQKMMQKIEDVRIMDSLVVSKRNFFEFYRLNEDAGRIFSVESETDTVVVCHTGFLAQRRDRMIFSDTINNQSDLFICNRLLDGWAAKLPLSDVLNTPEYDENFPFLMSDGVTLYFGSTGHESIGGYDIFLTRFNTDENEYFIPENIGMPFNSPCNDYLMVIDDFRKEGWFATDRFQAQDSVIIYQFKVLPNRTFLKNLSYDDQIEYSKMKKYNLYSEQFDIEPIMVEKIDTVTKDTLAFIERIEDKKEMFFVITEGVVYHSVLDFKSSEAKRLYEKAVEQENKRATLQKTLELKRQEYAQTASRVEKNKIATEIINLEKLFVAAPLPDRNFKLARNWEIKALGIKH